MTPTRGSHGKPHRTAKILSHARRGRMAAHGAQAYPSRPITIVVPFPAGGPTDTLARILAEQMRTLLGQSVIVENVTGASGSIGVGRVAKAAPDGYTLSIGHLITHVFNGAVFTLPYDPVGGLRAGVTASGRANLAHRPNKLAGE